MNSSNGKPAWSGFLKRSRIDSNEKSGLRQDRRRFQPSVAGLEDRKLMTASTLSTVASFHPSGQQLNGGVVMDTHGNLFGTTTLAANSGASTSGTIYEVANGSKTVTTLATFRNLNGYTLTGVSLDAQGNIYGAISGEGKPHGDGQVFEIPQGSKTVKILATFDGTNGAVPNNVMADAQGDVYGTTALGGPNPSATVFEIPRGSNTITTLASFSTPGSALNGVIMDAQGNLFGINHGGGNTGTATLFEIPRGSNTPTTIASFDGYNGSRISNLTMDSQGDFFGTTEDGGPFGDGTVFEVAHGSDAVGRLTSFDSTNGTFPNPNVGVVMDAQGNLFGATQLGGSTNNGTLFELPQGSHTVTTLTPIGGTTGADITGMILNDQGDLVGTTENGGASSGGEVFKFALNNPPK